MTKIKILPSYAAIESIRNICEPWIEMEGTEWGEVMLGLHTASQTSYGFSDEDCALFASKLLENLNLGEEFFFEYYDEEEIKFAQEGSRQSREYWLKGGNLGDWANTIEEAKSSIEQVPDWIFGNENG